MATGSVALNSDSKLLSKNGEDQGFQRPAASGSKEVFIVCLVGCDFKHQEIGLWSPRIYH